MASIPKPIRDWISQFFTEKGVPESSSDVNHDQTSNRTHEGDDISPATLEVDSAKIAGREYLETSQVNVSVDPVNGDDTNEIGEGPLQTIQEAVDRAPRYSEELYYVSLEDGTYDEDVIIPPFTGTGSRKGSLSIEGDTTTPSNVQIGSIAVIGSSGNAASPVLRGFELTRPSPHFDGTSSETALYVVGGGETSVKNIGFNPDNPPIENGVEAYASQVECNDVDVSGTTNGIKAKRGSTVQAVGTTGTADYIFFATESSHLTYWGTDATANVEGIRYDAGATGSTFNQFQGFQYANFNGYAYKDAPMRAVTRVGEKQPSKNVDGPSTIEFSNLSSDKRYVIEYGLQTASNAGDVFMRVNGDGDATGGYDYYERYNGNQTGENQALLWSLSNDTYAYGRVDIHKAGYNHDPIDQDIGSTSAVGLSGTFNGEVGSLEITVPSTYSQDDKDSWRLFEITSPVYVGDGALDSDRKNNF